MYYLITSLNNTNLLSMYYLTASLNKYTSLNRLLTTSLNNINPLNVLPNYFS